MRPLWKYLIVTCSVVWSLTQLYAHIFVRPIHGDEDVFVKRGRFFDLYTHGDFSPQMWLNYHSFDVPKFMEMYYGLVLSLSSKKNGDKLSQYLSVISHHQYEDE